MPYIYLSQGRMCNHIFILSLLLDKMGKTQINISSILLIVVLINFVTYAANARVLAGEGVATHKFSNIYEEIKNSGPSPGTGNDDPSYSQEFDWAGIDDSSPSPGDGGHDEPPPIHSFDWSGIKDSGPSHGGKGHK